MGQLTNATLQFMSVPPEKLEKIREIVRRARDEVRKHSNLSAGEFWKLDGVGRKAMEEVVKLLELPHVLIAIEKDTQTDRPFEYLTPQRMPPVVVIHPDVIDGIQDLDQRADLLGRLVFEAPIAHLAAHHAGKLNWKKVEEFFGWAAERAGL
jgi:hypothetical protein